MPNSADTAVERIREARERQPVAIETLREAVEGLHERIHNDSLSQEDRDAAKRELRQLRDDAVRMKGEKVAWLDSYNPDSAKQRKDAHAIGKLVGTIDKDAPRSWLNPRKYTSGADSFVDAVADGSEDLGAYVTDKVTGTAQFAERGLRKVVKLATKLAVPAAAIGVPGYFWGRPLLKQGLTAAATAL